LKRIFVSHTKDDASFCDRFGRGTNKAEISFFRSEFEEFDFPPWITINQQMENSFAMFLLVGEELVRRQELSLSSDEERKKWRYTQNWIAYEIGLASQLKLDVWVFCDGVSINFPVPYFNNYHVKKIEDRNDVLWLSNILINYKEGKKFRYGFHDDYIFACPNEGCRIEFNFHTRLDTDEIIICPACLNEISIIEGRFTAVNTALRRLKENARAACKKGQLYR